MLSSILYGISATDLLTFGGVCLLLGGVCLLLASVALVASAVPAWRASRLDPLEALRHE